MFQIGLSRCFVEEIDFYDCYKCFSAYYPSITFQALVFYFKIHPTFKFSLPCFILGIALLKFH